MKTQMQLAYEVAKTQIGIAEIAGDGHNKKILEYGQSTDVQADTDEIPWCSNFVNWCYIIAGIIQNPVLMRKLLTGKYAENDIELFLNSAKLFAKEKNLSFNLGFATRIQVKLPTRSGSARSFQNFSKTSPAPQEGDIVVFWRDNPASYKGHVAFLVKQGLTFVDVLGGNQSDKVCVAAYTRARVLSYRTDS